MWVPLPKYPPRFDQQIWIVFGWVYGCVWLAFFYYMGETMAYTSDTWTIFWATDVQLPILLNLYVNDYALLIAPCFYAITLVRIKMKV
jgi:hypothetical protein